MSRSTLVFVICLVIVAGGLGYYFFFFNSNTNAALSSGPEGSANNAEMSFVTLVSKLDPIVFDTSILSDPRFMTRQNIRTAIVPETAGRKDPFAPIGR